MNDNSLTLAIIGHLVGDYLLQNDWMALNKKQGSWACALHCLIWTTSVMVFSGWGAQDGVLWTLLWPEARGKLVIICLLLFTTHFIQDRTQIIRFWMTRINRQPKFAEPPMAPWSLIVVDNVWHILMLWIIWRFAI